MAPEYIESKRGKKKLQHNGFLFVFEKRKKDGDIKFWRCEAFNRAGFNCKAQIHTNLNDEVLKELNEHVCDTDAAGIQVQKTKTDKMKSRRNRPRPKSELVPYKMLQLRCWQERHQGMQLNWKNL